MTAPLERIGFMQGRLSAMVDGKIQAFPWNEWREEFPRAQALGLTRIEWTIDQDRLREYEEELNNLGVLLKDYHTGLVDFPCWMDDHEVYLCWRLGEDEVAHWHEIDAGFAGRQKLMQGAIES